jgi:CBS domain-containing protein
MKVKSIMTRDVTSCGPETTLSEAIRTMRRVDCGVLPVVRKGELIGVVTDRDIAIALGERDRRGSEVLVADAMSRGVAACREDDDLSAALEIMRIKRVRRLPVLDRTGSVCGILSMNDAVLRGEEPADGRALADWDILRTLRGICEHRYPVRPEAPPDVTRLDRFV